MTTLVAISIGIIGAWLVTKLVSLGDRKSRRVAEGYYVSPGYRAKTARQCRSEFDANMAMRAGMVR